MTLVLAICTSTSQSTVGLGTRAGVLAEARLSRPHAHAEFVAPAIEFCTRAAGVEASDVTGVVVDRGPGLFSGLRVGIATAKAVAVSLDLPVVALSGLDLVAVAVRHSGRTVVAATDARRGEVFWARYVPVHGGVERIGDYRVSTPEALAADIVAEGGETLVVGTGAVEYGDVFAKVDHVEVGDVTTAHPTAGAAIALAVDRFEREEFVGAHDVAPMYLRRSDAEIKWEARRSRV